MDILESAAGVKYDDHLIVIDPTLAVQVLEGRQRGGTLGADKDPLRAYVSLLRNHHDS